MIMTESLITHFTLDRTPGPDGYPASDHNHFMTVHCDECSACLLCHMTYEEVERWYHYGNVDQDEWEAYTYVWSISAWRVDGPDRPPHESFTRVWKLVSIMHEYNRSRGLVYGPWI